MTTQEKMIEAVKAHAAWTRRKGLRFKVEISEKLNKVTGLRGGYVNCGTHQWYLKNIDGAVTVMDW